MGTCSSTVSKPGSAGSGAGTAEPKRVDVASKKKDVDDYKFYAIRDNYHSFEDVSDALRRAGLEASQLILAIDFTKSNTWTGKRSYGGKCLHYLDPEKLDKNPYIRVIEAVGRTLAPFDDDNLIPVFGFGDSTTTDRSVFPFFADRPARGFEEVLARYPHIVAAARMSGPTNFAPAIEAAIQVVKASKQYHILVIIADGQVTNRAHTEAAIVRASAFPLSIVIVGVGDGPWDVMTDFDDALAARKFDNLQFVNATACFEANPDNPDVAFAVAALMEVPEQYLAIRKLGLL